MPSPLPRLKPDPIPTVNPLPEYLAEGQRKAFYDDTKTVLQVPWMGVVTMAFAHFPRFYGSLWGGLREVCGSEAFVQASAAIRRRIEDRVSELEPGDIREKLAEMGYAPRELKAIGNVIEVFSHGNMPYVLLATMARLLLEGHSLSAETAVTSFSGWHGPDAVSSLVLIERHHATGALRDIYDDVQETLGLPFVNTDYRALSRWPTYFRTTWQGLRPHVPTAAYEDLVADMHHFVVEQALALPNPGGLTSAALRAAADEDGSADQVLQVVRLFQWLLPGLITNVAFFRAQLCGPSA